MWRGDQNYTEDIAGKEFDIDRSVTMALSSNTLLDTQFSRCAISGTGATTR